MAKLPLNVGLSCRYIVYKYKWFAQLLILIRIEFH